MPRSKPRPARGNLPTALSTFIGREREIAEVKQLHLSHRLVTLTGPGGCGKTRLALQAAGELQSEFEDGVWLTELAPLADAALVPQALASALGVSEVPGISLMDTLAQHFLHLHALLLVDNCEHLIGACAQLADVLLKACPDLWILTTSREALNISGEAIFVVPSLSLPEPQPWRNPSSPEKALVAYEQSEAVRLFSERAALVSPSFNLTAENGMWVSEICRRLDGMPLAIELAAARVRALSVQQIAEHLDDRFHLLASGSRTAPPRHQSLTAALDWSYALLSEKEQKVLQRLSVFSGGATLEAVEFVCAGDRVEADEVRDTLSHLVDKSLTVADQRSGEMRYVLLETIRQYAWEKLAAVGELDEIKTRHLNYFVQWADRAEPGLSGGEQIVTRHLRYAVQSGRADPYSNEDGQILWLKRFEIEHDNLRAALEWSLTAANRAEAGLRLAAITAVFWKMHGHHSEGRTRLTSALAQEAVQGATLVRALGLLRSSLLAFYQSDYPVVRALAEESLVISRKHGPAGQLAVADGLEILAEVASETGNYSAATKLYEEALPLYKHLGDLAGIGDTLKMLGWGALRTGDYEKAESLLNEGLSVCRQSGDLHQIISALSGLGELALRRGEYTRAGNLLQESLTLNQRVGEKWGFAIVLGNLGWVALRQRDFTGTRKLLGQSLAVRMETGDQGGIAWCLEKLAEASSLQSRFRPAAIIFGAAAALRDPLGSVIDVVDRPNYERMISDLRTELGEDAFAAAWAEGKSMQLELVIDHALCESEISAVGSSPADEEKFGGLTAREREVAVLIAQGKSNREIARHMTVGVKTVETYVTRILNKLAFDSRVQIATWAIEIGLYTKESE